MKIKRCRSRGADNSVQIMACRSRGADPEVQISMCNGGGNGGGITRAVWQQSSALLSLEH